MRHVSPVDLARPSSLRLLALGLCLAGCATTSTAGDRGAVEAEVQDRLKLKGLTLPDPSDSTELPPELEPLLAQPLTPDAAARVALLANRSARAALAELGIARGAFVQAGVLPNPHAELDLRAPGGPQPAQLDLGLDLELTAMVLAPLKQGVAESQLEAAKWQAAGKLLELGYVARLKCLALQGALAREVLRRQALAALEASVAAAEELHRVGNLPPRELSTQRAAVELAKLQQLEAKQAVAEAREAFIRALGLPAGKSRFEVAALPERLPPPLPAEAAEGAAVAQSLELKAGLELAESASRALTLAQT
ncbi:MAG: TolC family protein, partial [Myxococcaceae bacterium]|nr:TolC family protein [Myxococcaceae bacterium]